MNRMAHADGEDLAAGPARGDDVAGALAPRRQLPNAPLVRAIFGALMAAGPQARAAGWRGAGRCVANHQRVGGRAFELRLDAASQEEAWRVVCGVTPLSLDLLTLLLARPDGGLLRARVIGARDLLEAKGYRRYGGERRAVERQLAGDLDALRRLELGTQGQRLFHLAPIEYGRCEFIYEPSAWLQDLALSAPMLSVPERILRYDHRSNRGADVLAKKLAIYLSLSVTEQGAVVRRVRSMLQAVGVPPHPAVSRGGRGGRLADRFDEALLRLQDHGLFAVRYRGGGAATSGVDRVKGWLNRWLEMEMVIARSPSAPTVRDLSLGALAALGSD
jgi:hypothetical protein